MESILEAVGRTKKCLKSPAKLDIVVCSLYHDCAEASHELRKYLRIISSAKCELSRCSTYLIAEQRRFVEQRYAAGLQILHKSRGTAIHIW